MWRSAEALRVRLPLPPRPVSGLAMSARPPLPMRADRLRPNGIVFWTPTWRSKLKSISPLFQVRIGGPRARFDTFVENGLRVPEWLSLMSYVSVPDFVPV